MAKGLNYGISFVVILILILVPVCFYKKSFCCSAFGSGNVSSPYTIRELQNVKNIAPVVVIGSGPAGLTAGLYASRLGFETFILEGAQPGGQLTTTSYIENWPGNKKVLGTELMENMRKHAMSQDVAILHEDVVSVDLKQWPYRVETSDGTVIKALTLIVATGSKPLLLNVPGEKEYWSKGVSTCAVCDAAFYKGKDVIVVGGGDSATEQALQLAVYAKSVNVLVRKGEMRASQAMQEEINKIPTVTVSYNTEVKKVIGDGKQVTSVELYDNKDDATITKSIDGIFLSIGSKPNTQILDGQLEVNDLGYIKVMGHSQRTSVPGVFAAGDVEDAVYKQAIVAAGEGSKAAIDAQHFLQAAGLSPETLRKIHNQFFVPSQAATTQAISSISTLAEFQEQVLASDKPVIMDFYTPSCASCKYMMPFFQEAAYQFQDSIKCLKVDAEKAKELSEKLMIAKVPAFLVYKGGKMVARYQKVMNKSQLMEFVSQFAQPEAN